MKSITLYTEKDTAVHKSDPLCKVLYVLVALLAPALIGGKAASMAMIVISFIILGMGKVLKKTMPLLGFSMLILVTVVIIQGLFRQGNVTPFLTIGKVVFYKEGLSYALKIVLNVINIIMSFAILILTTKPSDMVEAFVRIGLSPKLGYVMGSVFQIVPQMSENMQTITDAQRSRGMETEGKLMTRIKAFFPLISPVVMNSLITTKERAIALEVRGFSGSDKKTFLSEQVKHTSDKVIKIVLFAVLIVSLIWRIVSWLV